GVRYFLLLARSSAASPMKKINNCDFIHYTLLLFSSNFTRLPHLAGTPENLRLAKQIQVQWKEFGHEVKGRGRENGFPHLIFNTSLSEPLPPGYTHIEDVVPPYSAFSAQGMPQGDLVYVNYGSIEDFQRLERELGINCSGKIVIVRYGKIFRGNKVMMIISHLSVRFSATEPFGNQGTTVQQNLEPTKHSHNKQTKNTSKTLMFKIKNERAREPLEAARMLWCPPVPHWGLQA
uniref:PA domain-containing protein n=1 Tax=Podarcis muralis TaxID=64176 RepID=A0A670J7H5_PODMU